MSIDSQQNRILYALRDEFLNKMSTPDYHYSVQAVEFGSQLNALDSITAFPVLGMYPLYGAPDFDSENHIYNERVEIVIEGHLPVVSGSSSVVAANNLLEDIRNIVLRADKQLGGLSYDIRYTAKDGAEWGLIFPDAAHPNVITVMFVFSVSYRYFPRR